MLFGAQKTLDGDQDFKAAVEMAERRNQALHLSRDKEDQEEGDPQESMGGQVPQEAAPSPGAQKPKEYAEFADDQ